MGIAEVSSVFMYLGTVLLLAGRRFFGWASLRRRKSASALVSNRDYLLEAQRKCILKLVVGAQIPLVKWDVACFGPQWV
jgi:hypothetical protein